MQPLSMWSLLAHSHSLLSLFFFFFSIFFSLIYFLSFFHFFLLSFFLFFSARENQRPSLVWNEPVAGCSPISPTLGLLCLTTPKAKCVMSVFQEYSANWRYQVCSWCSSHVLVHRMPLILKMVSDKEYPRVHTNRQHVLSFICLVERFF